MYLLQKNRITASRYGKSSVGQLNYISGKYTFYIYYSGRNYMCYLIFVKVTLLLKCTELYQKYLNFGGEIVRVRGLCHHSLFYSNLSSLLKRYVLISLIQSPSIQAGVMMPIIRNKDELLHRIRSVRLQYNSHFVVVTQIKTPILLHVGLEAKSHQYIR